MYLATTALDRYWDKSQKILFLGEWCKLYGRKDIWAGLDSETLPFHWEDRNKFYNDFKYTQEIYEKTLPVLAEYLNSYHNENNSLRYWRIYVGAWLRYFIQILFERYESLNNAVAKNNDLETTIVRSDIVPQDFIHFAHLYSSDEYNLVLYSQILTEGNFNIRTKVNGNHPIFNYNHKTEIFHSKNILKAIIRKLFIEKIITRIGKRYNDILIYKSYLPRKFVINSYLKLLQFPLIETFDKSNYTSKSIQLDPSRQNPLYHADNIFEDILSKLVLRNIPKIYLEEYHDYKKYVMIKNCNKYKMIITGPGTDIDDDFKLYAAVCAEKKKKIIILQYGGGYGSTKFIGNEDHVCSICDIYLSWGWSRITLKNVKPFYFSKVLNIKPKKNGKILMLGCSFPRYSYWLQSAPISSSSLNLIKEHIEFIENLNPIAYKDLIYRLYHDYGWDEKNRIKDNFNDIKYENMNEISLNESLDNSKLVIVTYNATTLLETMNANFPMIAFWNPRYWELREEAVPYYEALINAGILYQSPSKCAKKVNEIYHDPLSWWMSKDVQEAKNYFCSYFARTTNDIVNELYKVITDIK